MIAKLQSDYIQLTQVLSTLHNKKQEFSSTDLISLISRISQKIKNLEEHSQEGFTPLSEKLRTDLTHLLKELQSELNPYIKQNKAVEDLENQIKRVEKALETAPIRAEKKAEKPQIGLKIAFFCDLDVPDHNSANILWLKQAIKQGVPFITTRSMLRASNVEDKDIQTSSFIDIEMSLLATQAHWEIFQQFDPEYGQELLLFLPKSLAPEKSGLDKLRALDFVIDGSLKQVSLMDALQGPQKKGNLQAFFKLFTQEPKLNKIFYLAGHGSERTIAALNAHHYTQFLDFIERQKCKGLLINSCSSGGKSSLINLRESQKTEPLSFEGQEKDHSFVTVVRSIGDFSTLAEQKAEEDLRKFLQKFTSFLENPGPETLSRFRVMIEEVEKEKEKNPGNLIKVYVPHSAGIPMGFRPLDEHGRGFSLTYNLLRKKELETNKGKAQKKVAKETIPEIFVLNKNFLEVHPLIADIQITFSKADSILLSMVPGNSYHFIQAIQLIEDPDTFLHKTIDFHRSAKNQARKAFFIGKLLSKDQRYEEVILYINSTRAQYVYRQNNQAFLFDGLTTTAISDFQYAVTYNEIIKRAQPNELAIRATSGGQESKENFLEFIQEGSFWKDSQSKIRDLTVSLDTLIQTNKIKDIVPSLNAESLTSLVFYLLHQGHHALASEIYNESHLDPNVKNLQGLPLLFQALLAGHFDIFKLLVGQGANLEAINPLNKRTLLHQAVIAGRLEIVKLLLEKDVDVNSKNAKDWTPITYAVKNPEIFSLLIQKGAALDIPGDAQITPLGLFVLDGLTKELDTFLAVKANPNAGTPSALTLAIYSRNLEAVKKLVEAGGKPFESTDSEIIPFVEAILNSTPEIVQYLLELPDCNLVVQDGEGISPALAALFSGNKEKIALLKSRDAPFPLQLTYQTEQMLNTILFRLTTLKDFKAIQEFLEWNHSRSSIIDYTTAQFFLTHQPHMAVTLIERGLINPNASDETGMTLFSYICQQAIGQLEGYEELIQTCIQRGADLNQQDQWHSSIIEKVIEAKDVELMTLLLNSGADISKTSDPGHVFSLMIELNDLNLIKLAASKGASIHQKSEEDLLPLQMAVLNLKKDPTGKVLKWMVKQGANLNEIGANNRTPFNDVIRSGNISLVDYCLAHGANPKLLSEGMFAPLSWAANLSDPKGQIFKKLVEAGADMNASEGSTRATPFSTLAAKAKLPLIEWAIANGAQINPSNPFEKLTPLQSAAQREGPEGEIIFKYLIERGADLNEPGNQSGPAPFVSLIESNRLKLVQQCLANGVQANLKVKADHTPLQAAAKLSDPTIFKLLLDFEADVNEQGPNAQHVLFSIIEKGNVELLELCFEKGAKLEDPEMQTQVLKLALSLGQIEIIKRLVDKGYSIHPTDISADFILNAYQAGGEQMLKLLADLKAPLQDLDPQAKALLWTLIIDRNDASSLKLLLDYPIEYMLDGNNIILQKVIEMERIGLLHMLVQLQFSIDFDAIDSESLYVIVNAENIEMLKILVNQGLNLNKRYGQTSFLEAAFDETLGLPRKNSIRYLLKAGADAKERFSAFETPAIYVAVQSEDPELVEMLLQAGAKSEIHVKDKYSKKSAIDLARKSQNPEILQLLSATL